MKRKHLVGRFAVALAPLFIWAGAAPGDGQSVYDTDDSGGKPPNIVIRGQSGGVSFGSRVAVGDVTGDGIADLVASAPQLSTINGLSTGAVYVIKGRSGFPDEIEIDFDGSGTHAMYSGREASDQLGTSLLIADVISPSGDVPDGVPDLIVTGTSAATLQGHVWIVPGPIAETGGPIDIDAAAGGAVIDYTGESEQDRLGASAAVGDFDGDGFADLALGAPRVEAVGPDSIQSGAVYVLKSPLGQGSFAIDVAADVTIHGGEQLEDVGRALVAVDLSLGIDGIDLAVGAPGAGTEDAGGVYLFDGGSGSPYFELSGQVFDLESDTATVWIEGFGAGRLFGGGLAAGDIDGDSRPDLCVVGAAGGKGAAHVLRGTGAPWPARIDLDEGGTWLSFDETGPTDSVVVDLAIGQFHPAGHPLFGTGDDLFLGSPLGAGGQGAAYFIPGRGSFGSSKVSSAAVFHTAILGTEGAEHLGNQSAIGDIDNDGRPDLITGAPGGEGTVRILLGGTPYTWGMSPAPGAANVPRNHDTIVRIYDDIMSGGSNSVLDEGVLSGSIGFTVNGVPFPSELVEVREPLDDPGQSPWKLEALIHWPVDSVGPGDVLQVRVDATDLGGHPIITEGWSYTITSDIESPFVKLGSTYPGALADTLPDVPLVTPIRARIQDNIAIGDSTVVMTVSFKRVTELNPDPDGYRETITVELPDTSVIQLSDGLVAIDYFTYPDFFWTGLDSLNPPLRERFIPNDTVTVTLDAEDHVGNPLRDPRVFSFITIIDDDEPPYIAYPPFDGATNPTIGQSDVREDQRTDIQINDDAAGVRLKTWKWFCPSCTTATQADAILSDEQKDQLRPKILRIIPRSGQDPDTVNVTLHGTLGERSEGPPVCTNGKNGRSEAPHCAKWTYFPNPQYRFNSEVRFLVSALDWAGNELIDDVYFFNTVEDVQPPFVVKTIPADGEQAPTSVSVAVEIDDDISGLADSTVALSYQTESMGGFADILLGDLEFQACDPPCNDGKRIVWTPEEAFMAGQVTMRVSAADRAENPMVPPFEWTFTATPDLIPPDIDILLFEQGRQVADTIFTSPDSLGRARCAEIDPVDDQHPNDVPRDSLLFVVTIEEPRLSDTGIDLGELLVILNLSSSEQLLLVAAGDVAAGAARVGTVTIDPHEDAEGILESVEVSIRTDLITLGLGRTLSLETEVADLEEGLPVPNYRSCTLFFTTTLSGLMNEPIPRIITPGMAGDNDDLVVQFPGGSAGSNPLKIFNRRGELVISIRPSDLSGEGRIAFAWDGRDERSELVPGGLYIYQYDSGDQVFSGTMGVAR
ncbi:MAG: hypothetical protein CME06_03030 [Gemmatimonadetes bacterium]|nr:hypothetical protein [Gemmatimonadota bacterium]